MALGWMCCLLAVGKGGCLVRREIILEAKLETTVICKVEMYESLTGYAHRGRLF